MNEVLGNCRQAEEDSFLRCFIAFHNGCHFFFLKKKAISFVECVKKNPHRISAFAKHFLRTTGSLFSLVYTGRVRNFKTLFLPPSPLFFSLKVGYI